MFDCSDSTRLVLDGASVDPFYLFAYRSVS
jgi:hypothetical protein